MKARTILVLLFLTFGSSALGQQCSVPGMTLRSINGAAPCTPNYPIAATLNYSITNTYEDNCTNTNNGNVYFDVLSSMSGGGQCSNYATNLPCGGSGQPACNQVVADCNPIFQPQKTSATSPSDFNRFYNRVWSQSLSWNGNTPYCVKGAFNQDFQQCQGVECQCSGGAECCSGQTAACNNGTFVCSGGATPCLTPPPQCGSGGAPVCDCTGWVCQSTGNSSPIIIDTTGTGFQLTDSANGVRFDLDPNRSPQQLAWTRGGSRNGWLALPHDGKVQTGRDLFGNFTPQPPSNDPNGFLALAVYDQPENGGNGDGIIDWHDAVYEKLRVWIDENHDGKAQPNELYTLPAVGIYSIGLAYTESKFIDRWGNQFRYKGTINPTGNPLGDHIDRVIYDVFLESAGSPEPKIHDGRLDNLLKDSLLR